MWGIFIRKSKTDLESMGLFMILDVTNQDICPPARMQSRLERMDGEPNDTKVFGGDIIGLVTRLIKRIAAERGLPSDRVSIQSLRAGGAACLYHSGVDVEYIRRFRRWRSIDFAIYLHFGDKILRNLPSCLARCDGLTSQLKLRTDNPEETLFDKKGR